MENKRGGRSSAKQQINPAKAEADMLIKEELNKKKNFGNYKRQKRALNMIEYYDYEDDEGQDEIDKLSIDDKAEIKRGKNIRSIRK